MLICIIVPKFRTFRFQKNSYGKIAQSLGNFVQLSATIDYFQQLF